MNRTNRDDNMEIKILGLILLSLGMGMIIANLFQWWGYIAAVILVAVGVYLIFHNKC